MADVTISVKGRTIKADIYGEIDHHWAARVREIIDRNIISYEANELIMDLSGITFMDSSGIGLILGRYKTMTILGGTISVIGANEEVNRMLILAGVTKVIECREVKYESYK